MNSEKNIYQKINDGHGHGHGDGRSRSRWWTVTVETVRNEVQRNEKVGHGHVTGRSRDVFV